MGLNKVSAHFPIRRSWKIRVIHKKLTYNLSCRGQKVQITPLATQKRKEWKNMKISMKSELLVLAKCAPTHSKDGQNTYYKLTVLQGQEAGQVSCPLEVYNSIKEGGKMLFNMEYNSEYKSLRLLGIAKESLSGATPTGTPGAGAPGAGKDK